MRPQATVLIIFTLFILSACSNDQLAKDQLVSSCEQQTVHHKQLCGCVFEELQSQIGAAEIEKSAKALQTNHPLSETFISASQAAIEKCKLMNEGNQFSSKLSALLR